MAFRKLVLATAAVGLAAAPVMAEVSTERTQPVGESSKLAGQGSALYLLGAAVVIGGIILIADSDDDDDDPVSA